MSKVIEALARAFHQRGVTVIRGNRADGLELVPRAGEARMARFQTLAWLKAVDTWAVSPSPA